MAGIVESCGNLSRNPLEAQRKVRHIQHGRRRSAKRGNIKLMKKERRRFNVVLRPEPEGGFTAIVPALPGCVTYGRNLAEARSMVRDAVLGYVESLRKHREPLPTQ
jgi:predicted RNase H-like HicB family nuclease